MPTLNSQTSMTSGVLPAGSKSISGPLNIPNTITLSRLALSAVLFWMMDQGGMWVPAACLFVFAAATDALDGYIARRYGMVTVLGRILDPFVDKVIICGAFIFLLDRREFPAFGSGMTAWMVTIVVGRELFITSVRSFLEREGKDFSAVWSGKIKMVLQCVAVVVSLLSLSDWFLKLWPDPKLFLQLRDVTLWAAVGVTLYSGITYLVRAFRLIRQG